jgi:DNA-binding cell septation regulator SpoVG
MEVTMEVTRYKSMENDGPVVAFFSLKIPKWGMTLNDCRLIRTKNGGFFVGFPSKKYEDNGETKYSPYIWLEKDVSERFQTAAKEAIDAYVKRSQPQEQPHVQPNATPDDNCPF